MYLEQIDSPHDVKKLTVPELDDLCAEMRQALLQKLSEHGGHIGPNLGIVEVTTALHYVFDSPIDKIVYDVSHQSYVHKMLTGRRAAFLDPQKYDDVSGYSCPQESEHDFFEIGHTSTSISLACGLARDRDLSGGRENIIALIGDGSLSGGEAYEGLNNAAEAGTNMIIIVNDNDMSIAENYGGLYRNLQELKRTGGQAVCNFFRALGLDYRFVADGHDFKQLIPILQEVKDIDHPVVVHIHTLKGKGYAPAELHKEQWHWGMPFKLETGEPKAHGGGEDYGSLTADYLLSEMKSNPRLAVITSGTPMVFGFDQKRRRQAGRQFIDVGIAEEHAVAMASGMAKRGGSPVYGVYATFLQRTYDQLSQDLCINNNPALLLVFMASVYGMNDVTHLGLYDIAMLSNIPNLVYLAPTCCEEYLAMLQWGIAQKEHPAAIRVPIAMVKSGQPDTTDYSQLNKYQVTQQGSRIAIIALGSFYSLGQAVAAAVQRQYQQTVTLINPKFISGLDEQLLRGLEQEHQLVVTLEDGILDGGFGQKIAGFYGASAIQVQNYGIKKSFPDRYIPETLLQENGLTVEQLTQAIAVFLQQDKR